MRWKRPCTIAVVLALALWGLGCRGGAIRTGRDAVADHPVWRDASPDRRPDVSRDVPVAPDAGPDSSVDGCLWEPDPSATLDLPILPINGTDQYWVDIWGHKIAYLDRPEGHFVLHVFDFESQEEQVVGEDDLDAGVLQGMGMVRGNRIVYKRLLPRGTYVWLYVEDLTTRQARVLAEGPNLNLHGHMAWPYLAYTQCVQDCSGMGADRREDLLLLNMETGDQQMLVSSEIAPTPFPGGAGPYVMWLESRTGYGMAIMVYDALTGERWAIPESAQGAEGADGRWWGQRVAWFWQESLSGGADVYVTDMETRQTTRLTTDPGDQGPVTIWGSVVMWADNRWREASPTRGLSNYDLVLQDLDNGIRIRLTTCPARYVYLLGDGWVFVGLPQNPQASQYRPVAYDLRAAGIMDQDGHLLPNPELEF